MKSLYKLYVLSAFVGLSTACTEVDLCEETIHPHVASLKVGYEWGSYGSEKPEQMHLVAARILNTYHCCYNTRAEDGAFLVESSEEPEKPEEPVTPDDTDIFKDSDKPQEPTWVSQAETSILGGEYFMMAFTKNDKSLEVVKLEEFLHDNSISVRDIRLRNKLLESKDYPNTNQDANIKDEDKEKAWVDFNPGYKFVASPGRVFIDRVNYVKFTTGTKYTQTFKLTPLTQRVNFSFTMDFDNTDTEGALTIDPAELYMEIAGVIPEVGLADGLLYTGSLRRMFLNTEKDGVKVNKDEQGRVKTITYNGYIDAFGLMPGPDAHAISGPGVLRLAMRVTLPGGGTRMIRTSRNISDEIAAANLTKTTGYSNIRERVVAEGSVRVSRNIQINTKKVIAGNSDGVTGWDQAFVDVDI